MQKSLHLLKSKRDAADWESEENEVTGHRESRFRIQLRLNKVQ